MNDYTTKRLELFDEKFPPKQNEATHFEDCICWSCNYYRDDVKKFLAESIQIRDDFWKKQEMGKSSDCVKHCEEAVAEERERVNQALDYIASFLNKH